MSQTKTKSAAEAAAAAAQVEVEVEYLSKRHRLTPAIVREIITRIGSSERGAVERAIKKGMSGRR